MDPEQEIIRANTALYFGWPKLTSDALVSVLAHSFKAELFCALENNYLQSVGPIYFGIETQACWPPRCLLDMLGILKKADLLPIFDDRVEVTLEVAAYDVQKYDFKAVFLAGVTRINLVIDCTSWEKTKSLGVDARYIEIFREYGFAVAIEFWRVKGIFFPEILRKMSSYCTHITVWPVYEEDTEIIHNELALYDFSSYARFHYGCSGHESEYMKHLWLQNNTLGLGPRAESMKGMLRKINPVSIVDYCSNAANVLHPDYWSHLSRHSFINEYIMLNAGTRQGVCLSKCMRFMTAADFFRFRKRLLRLQNHEGVWITNKAFGILSHSESVFQDGVANLFLYK